MLLRTAIAFLVAIVCCATSANAEWRIEFESKTVPPNETDVTVNLTAYWDYPLQLLVVPVVVRSIDSGSFWTGSLPYDTFSAAAHGVTWNWAGPWAQLGMEMRPVVPEFPYNVEGDTGYDGVSPDHFYVFALSLWTFTPPEPTGRDILTLTFDASGHPGQFEFDTACISYGIDVIYMYDGQLAVDHGPKGLDEVTFNKGVITIDGGVLCMNSTSVLPGHNATITLNAASSMDIGGFDFLLSYDPTIAFLDAVPVGTLANWEYFTYRKSIQDNCGGGCPTGVLRLIGLANLPDGQTPDDAVYSPTGPIVELTFGTPESLNYIGQCFHVSWTWYDCGDNTLSSRLGDTLYLARDIDSILFDPGCLVGDKGFTPLPKIDFCDGLICIIPPDDDRGDINLNGIANEIADAVLFSNYFISGPDVLHNDGPIDYYDARVLASDVNDDGIPLTIADLVYLIRIITGDAIPYGESGEGGRMAPFAHDADLRVEIGNDLAVSSSAPVSVGGAAFVFRHTGEIGTPVVADDIAGMTLRSSDRDGTLRVLVYSMESVTIPAGSHVLFTLPLGGSAIELLEAQFSDADGNLLGVSTDKLAPPTAYALLQNYPNPFNAGTAIRFTLPRTSDWSLGIYNVTGQLVKEFSGHNDAGMVNLRWDATHAASGMYFYKLTAGEFTDTRKMTLMK